MVQRSRAHALNRRITDLDPRNHSQSGHHRVARWVITGHSPGRGSTMTISVCPGDEVHASADQVWSLLNDPTRFDAWWDARVLEASPPGPLSAGQRVVARAKGASPRGAPRPGSEHHTAFADLVGQIGADGVRSLVQ